MDGLEGSHWSGTRRSRHAGGISPRAKQSHRPEFCLERGQAAIMHKRAAARAKTRSEASALATSWSEAVRGEEPYPLPSWKNHGHRRDKTAAAQRAPKQLDPAPGKTPPPLETRYRRRHSPPTAQRSSQPNLFPKQLLQEGYDAMGVAAAQQCCGFHQGNKGEGGGGQDLTGASRKVCGARGRRHRRSRRGRLGVFPRSCTPSTRSHPAKTGAPRRSRPDLGGGARRKSVGEETARSTAAEAKAAAAAP